MAAREWYGLTPLIVLYNPPDVVLHLPIKERFQAWARYVDEVATRAAHLCDIYQLLNEPNNPVYQVFPRGNCPEAIIMGADLIRRRTRSAKITINILAGLLGWQAQLEALIRAARSSIDIIGLDYYPGTWTVSSRSDAVNWTDLAQKLGDLRSKFNNIPIGILETGYSTNIRWCRGNDEQAKYFTMLRDGINHWSAQIGPPGFTFLGIHELTDSGTDVLLDPEAHFGLLTSGALQRKVGFDAAMELFRIMKPSSDPR
jgi:hypothetical protein